MYRPQEHIFAFRLKRDANQDQLEGISLRYTAMALIGLAGESDATSRDILRGESTHDICARMIARLNGGDNFGDIAALLWACAHLNHAQTGRVLKKLIELDPASDRHPTVERAWALTALSLHPELMWEPALAERLAAILMKSFNVSSGIFSHMAPTAKLSPLRAHVACFADLVYPTIALSHFGTTMGDDRAISCARACAQQMCHTQGTSGQWWWHFDARTGRVVEEYPVYAVHQDAMAPMALFAAEEACRAEFGDAIRRGVDWLAYSPEINGSLIDRSADVIWRKVGRREPNKLSRGVNAALSAIHPDWRAPGLDSIFRPVQIDHESRPYHMGWILHAWPAARVEEFAARWKGKTHEPHAIPVADAPSV